MKTIRLTAVMALMAPLSSCGEGSSLAPISVEPFVALAGAEGESGMSSWPRVSPRHPAGFRIAVPQPGLAASQPLVFSDSGRPVGTIGRMGSGEGELIEPLFARIGTGDSIWLFDGSRRALIYDQARNHVRTVALPVSPWDARILPDGRVAVTSATFGRPMPFHLLDAEGTIIDAVGDSADMGGSPSPRRLVVAPDGTIWTVAMSHRWRLEQWSVDGTSVKVLDSPPDWFVPYDTIASPSASVPPSPSVQDAWFDEAGRLWVLGKVADRNWADGIGIGTGGQTVIADQDRVYDTVFEVLDPDTGRRLLHGRIDTVYPFAVESGVVMRVVPTADGWYRAELARVVTRE